MLRNDCGDTAETLAGKLQQAPRAYQRVTEHRSLSGDRSRVGTDSGSRRGVRGDARTDGRRPARM